MVMENSYLICLLTLLRGVGAFDKCPYNGLLGPSTMSCLYGCCGSTFDDACCDSSDSHIPIIVGSVIGGLILIIVIVGIVCSCCFYRKSGMFGRRHMFGGTAAGHMVGQPYTAYPQNSTTVLPQTGVQTSPPLATYNVAGTTGPVYPPTQMQQSTGNMQTGLESKETIQPSAPPPSRDPPSYSEVTHSGYSYGNQ